MGKAYTIQCHICKEWRTLGKRGYFMARKDHSPCRRCQRSSPEWRKKQSDNRKKQSPPTKGMKFSEEHKQRLRENNLTRIKARGCAPRYNPLATHVFNGINRRMGWNGQHAGNGGEKQVAGYSLDYYVELPECILVIEWDEPYHLRSGLIKKDFDRQKRIEDKIGPT